MPDLIFGVIDTPYQNEGISAPPRITKTGKVHRGDVRRAARAYQNGAGGEGLTTTVTVARALEEKYHVFQVFYEHNEGPIKAAVIHGLEVKLEALYSGDPVHDLYDEIGDELTQGFRQWLLQGEIETLGIDGVPTKAALERKSSRFKSGKGPNERPSFIDTGTYELASKVWVE